MATSSKKPAGPLCCVTIGYHHYLMPMDKGLKVVDLMSHAVACDLEFDRNSTGTKYRIEGPVEITFTSIKPGQILPPKAEEFATPGRRGIGLEMLKLEGSK